MGEYFQLSSNFVTGFFVYIATIYAKSEIILIFIKQQIRIFFSQGKIFTGLLGKLFQPKYYFLKSSDFSAISGCFWNFISLVVNLEISSPAESMLHASLEHRLTQPKMFTLRNNLNRLLRCDTSVE